MSRRVRATSSIVAPVVTTSSTITTHRFVSSCGAPERMIMDSCRLAWRAARPRPAWSQTRRPCRTAGTTAQSTPARRSTMPARRATRSRGSYPRWRVAVRADGAGTKATGRRTSSNVSSRWPAAAASAAPNGRDSPSRPCSLCASTALRTAPPYVHVATTGIPPGRRPRTRAGPPNSRRQAGQSRPGDLAQPAHIPPRARSAAAVGSCLIQPCGSTDSAWPRRISPANTS
jgi:hypothetical protein